MPFGMLSYFEKKSRTLPHSSAKHNTGLHVRVYQLLHRARQIHKSLLESACHPDWSSHSPKGQVKYFSPLQLPINPKWPDRNFRPCHSAFKAYLCHQGPIVSKMMCYKFMYQLGNISTLLVLDAEQTGRDSRAVYSVSSTSHIIFIFIN